MTNILEFRGGNNGTVKINAPEEFMGKGKIVLNPFTLENIWNDPVAPYIYALIRGITLPKREGESSWLRKRRQDLARKRLEQYATKNYP